MIVLDYIDLGGHLSGRVAVRHGRAHLCPQSSFVTSAVTSLLYFEAAFITRYLLAKMQTNQAGWLFIVHVFFYHF